MKINASALTASNEIFFFQSVPNLNAIKDLCTLFRNKSAKQGSK